MYNVIFKKPFTFVLLLTLDKAGGGGQNPPQQDL